MSIVLVAFVLQTPVYSVPERHQIILIKFSLGGSLAEQDVIIQIGIL